MAKKLSENSRFAQFDLDNDGTVTDDEIAHAKDMLELELREEKADAQKRWLGLLWLVWLVSRFCRWFRGYQRAD